MKKVTIYGAGMSGVIAAINLARDGFEVEVFDREPGYGCSHLYTLPRIPPPSRSSLPAITSASTSARSSTR